MTASEDNVSPTEQPSTATPTSNSETDLAPATAASPTDDSEVIVIEKEDDEKEEIPSNDIEACSEDLDTVEECVPLKSGASNIDSPESSDGKILTDDEELGETEIEGPRKKQYDVRCIVVGILVLVILVAGASAAILAHKFKGKLQNGFQFASYFGDHMVLQRSPHQAVVWGYGPMLVSNISVKVIVEGESINYKQEYSSHLTDTMLTTGLEWKVVLDTVSVKGPFIIRAQLELEGEVQEISLKHVVFGDVWVCAGQSKLNFPLHKYMNTTQGQSDLGENTDLRLFALMPHKSNVPRYHVQHFRMLWTNPASISGDTAAMFSELCWHYGVKLSRRLQYPVGLVAMVDSESVIDEWAPPQATTTCKLRHRDISANVWNAMVNPMLQLSLYGLIWDQGERDALELTQKFDCLFVQLITEWRRQTFMYTSQATDASFPVGVVQLPPNSTNQPFAAYTYTDIRWRQTANFGFLPNALQHKVFMAPSIDLPETQAPLEYVDILTNRLVNGALNVAYKQRDFGFEGPFPVKYVIQKTDKTLQLDFDPPHIAQKSNEGFEVCCSNDTSYMCLSSYTKSSIAPGREWLQAPVVTSSASSVKLSFAACSEGFVVAVRYAWRDEPCAWLSCPIYSSLTDIPMSPFVKVGLLSDGRTHDLPKEQSVLL